MSGIDSGSVGPKFQQLLPAYQVTDRDISFKLRLKPISKGDMDIQDMISSTIDIS
jgi:hypothetical protein